MIDVQAAILSVRRVGFEASLTNCCRASRSTTDFSNVSRAFL